MAGLRKTDLRSNESAMKYFILGSFATGFLLYGMALIYGATGTTNIRKFLLRVADREFPCAAFDRRRDAAHRFRIQSRHRSVSRLDTGRLRRRADTDYGIYGGRTEIFGFCLVC